MYKKREKREKRLEKRVVGDGTRVGGATTTSTPTR